jgi:hypothetical protein
VIKLRDAVRGAKALGQLGTSPRLRESMEAMIRLEKAEAELSAVCRPGELGEALSGVDAAWRREVQRAQARPWPPIPREELTAFVQRRLAEGRSVSAALRALDLWTDGIGAAMDLAAACGVPARWTIWAAGLEALAKRPAETDP